MIPIHAKCNTVQHAQLGPVQLGSICARKCKDPVLASTLNTSIPILNLHDFEATRSLVSAECIQIACATDVTEPRLLTQPLLNIPQECC